MRQVGYVRPAACAVAIALVALALGIGGCGGSSGSRASSTATGTHSTAVSAAGSYHGDGFEVAIPAGWRRVASSAAATGARGVVFGPAGDTKTSITIHSYRQPTEGIDQTIADVLTSDKVEESTGQLRDIRAHVRTTRVQGASSAKVLTESFVGPAGPVHYIDLVVMTPAGTLITVEAAAPARASGFDPANAVESLRVTGG